jgi:hypothetical protein
MFDSILMRLVMEQEVHCSSDDVTLIREDEGDNGGDTDDTDDTNDEDTDTTEGGGGSDEDSDKESDSNGDDSDKDGDSDKESDGEDSDGEDSKEDSNDGDSKEDSKEDSNGDSNGDSNDGDSDGDGDDSDQPSKQAGTEEGGNNALSEERAKKLLEQLLSGENPLKDNAEALADAFNDLRDDDCLPGEQIWRPFCEEDDLVNTPWDDADTAKQYRAAGKLLTAAMRTSFKRKFLQAREPQEEHGVLRGDGLSEPLLVESWIEVQATRRRPRRPDYRVVEQEECSLAVAVIGDESGSMCGENQAAAATAMLSIADCFDALGSPVLCCGIQNGGRASGSRAERLAGKSTGLFHRRRGVVYNLFKDWHEPIRSCWKRFGSYDAGGGTPLSDGIQYGLRALSERQERHRVLIVLTDGQPCDGAVIKRQIRLAREAGITIIGVGIGGGCGPVRGLFPAHVVVDDLDSLPKQMINAITSVVFPKKARRVKIDGPALGAR